MKLPTELLLYLTAFSILFTICIFAAPTRCKAAKRFRKIDGRNDQLFAIADGFATSECGFVQPTATQVENSEQADTSEFSAPDPLTTINGISEYRLENGLTILLLPDPTTSNVTIRSIHRCLRRHLTIPQNLPLPQRGTQYCDDGPIRDSDAGRSQCGDSKAH